MLGHNRLTTFLAATVVAQDTGILNSAKLSLPANTPLGTRVKVSDGFVFTNEGDGSGFYGFDGRTHNGKSVYTNTALNASVYYHDNGNWTTGPSDFSDFGIYDEAAPGNEAYPWLATWSSATLTHPAVQELTAPSTAQGGVFVSGGSQDGIWEKFATQYQGKDAYGLLGVTDGFPQDAASLFWQVAGYPNPLWLIRDSGAADLYYSLSDVATPDLAGSDKFVMAVSGVAYSKRGTFNGKSYYNVIGQSTSTSLSAIFWSSATWHITNAVGVDLDTSTSAVATPDLATFLLGTVVTNTAWLNASDDSPASITVTSVTQGELDAGVLVTGAGTATSNGVFQTNGSNSGVNQFSKIGRPATIIQMGDPGGYFTMFDADAVASTYHGPAAPQCSPWLGGAWAFDDGELPVPTVTRDDVASEANWSNV